MMDFLIGFMATTVSIAMACVGCSALHAIGWAKQDIRLRQEEADRRKPKPQA